MPDRFVSSHIKRLPLFARIPDDQLDPIVDAFQVMRFEPGEVLFHQGQPAAGMYMFISGQGVLVQQGADGIERQIGIVGENQFINEVALFKPLMETATLQIIERSVVLVLTRQRLLRAVSEYPQLKAMFGIPGQPVQPQPPAPSMTGQGGQMPPTAPIQNPGRGDQVGRPPIKEDAPPPQTSYPLFRGSFEGQREDETVLVQAHRHWWAFGRTAWLPIALFIVMGLGALLVNSGLLTVVLCGLALIFPGLIMLYLYFEWRNDQLIISDQRALQIERHLLTLSTSIVEIPLASINEVNAEIPPGDPFARMFRYGTLKLKTAGTTGNITFNLVSDPDRIQDIIFEQKKLDQQDLQGQQRQAIRAEIDRLIAGDSPRPTTGGKPSQGYQETAGLGLARTKFTMPDGATVYRKHFFIWLRDLIPPLLVILAGLFLLGLRFLQSDFLNVPILIPFAILLLGAAWAYYVDWDWRNDMYIVDDEKISLIHRRPLWLQNENDQILLSRVDNVTSHTSGLFQNLFNHGDVRISLVGGDANSVKVFEAVHNPREVQAEISRRQSRSKQKSLDAEAKRQRDTIGEYISVYHETLQRGGQPTTQSAPVDDEGDSGTGAPPPRDSTRPPNVPRVRRD